MFLRLAILALILMIAIGCGSPSVEKPGSTQRESQSVVESPKTATAIPSTKLPSTPTPAPMGASISPTATSVPPKLTQPSSGLAFSLEINEMAADLPKYDREDWKHWIDEDKDCQNTRHEVLIEESLKAVTFKSDKQCQVATGEWLAPFTGDTVTDGT